MIEIRTLMQLSLTDLKNVASGYTSNSIYAVTCVEKDDRIVFDLQLITRTKPYVKQWNYDGAVLQRYQQILTENFSLGAYDGQVLVGMIIAEPHKWNRSLWVWEFPVTEPHRNKGIGKQVMEHTVKQAKRTGLRTIICETQNTNAPTIQVCRKLGFRMEGIDLSYYSNNDYPHGEMAIFMKHRLL